MKNYKQQYSIMLYHLRQNQLTEYLKLLAQDYLEEFFSILMYTDLIDEGLLIYGAIKNELEYRESDLQLEKRKSLIK